MTAMLFADFDARSAVDLRPAFANGPAFEVRIGNRRPGHAVYVRRRLVVALVAIGLIAVIGACARSLLADRGGVPASTPAIRSAPIDDVAAAQPSQAVVPAAVATPAAIRYIVQPGDTLWLLAERFHGTHGLTSYLDTLVQANGGATVQPGQLLDLP